MKRRLVWLDWFVAAMLLATTVVSFWHGEAMGAVIEGVCAGTVLGAAFVRTIDVYFHEV